MRLKDQTALVTGGSRSIGREIALGFAREGADVAVNYVQDIDAAQHTVREIEAFGRRALAVKADTSKSEEVAAMVAFLCSPDAGYITRQVFSVNGGMC